MKSFVTLSTRKFVFYYNFFGKIIRKLEWFWILKVTVEFKTLIIISIAIRNVIKKSLEKLTWNTIRTTIRGFDIAIKIPQIDTMDRFRLWRYKKLENENVRDNNDERKEDYSCFKLRKVRLYHLFFHFTFLYLLIFNLKLTSRILFLFPLDCFLYEIKMNCWVFSFIETRFLLEFWMEGPLYPIDPWANKETREKGIET